MHSKLKKLIKAKLSKITLGLAISVFAGFVTNYTFPFLPFSTEQEITFKNINSEYPVSVGERISEALDNYKAKNYEFSLTHLKSISISIHNSQDQIESKQEALIYLIMGACYYELQEFSEATKFLEKSISLAPSPYPHKVLSEIYFQQYITSHLKKDLDNHKKHSDKAYKLKISLFEEKKGQANSIDANKFIDTGLEKEFYSAFLKEPLTNPIERLGSKNIELSFVGQRRKQTSLSSAKYRNKFNKDALNHTFVTGIGRNRNKGKTHLISIGINHYSDTTITPLSYAEKDSKDIIKAFSKIYGKNLLHYNILGKDANKKKILSTIISVNKVLKPNDNIVLYYSGHGYAINKKLESSTEKENYIFPEDGNINNLEISAISLKYISNIIKGNSRSRSLIIIDACNENIYNDQESTMYSKESYVEKKNTTIIYSSSNGQLSAESSKFRNGVFTHFFNKRVNIVNSLDNNHDGNVSIKELVYPVEIDMNNYLARLGLEQKISIFSY